nr:hypothetical protein [Prevotella sp.]
MKKNNIYIFYAKCIALCLPFIILVLLYMAKDPFMVIRHYNDYDHCRVCQSEGAVAWTKYKMLRNKMHYDSFIMGNSCTKAFPCKDWNRYIHARPFRLFSNGEGLGDLCLKLEALDHQHNQPVRNLLIITEKDFFENVNPQNSIMHIMPIDVSNKSLISYQTAFLQGFFDPKFLFPYLKYQITDRYDNSMRGVVNEHIPVHTYYANDAVLPAEDSIRIEGENFWMSKQWMKEKKKKAKSSVASRVICSTQIKRLNEIENFCERHHTDMKLVIGTNYKREAVNPLDVKTLKSIFGNNNVFDYSSSPLKMDYHNYYDNVHYRVTVGKKIMKEIYRV